MKPYYQDDWVTIYHGDCRDILPHLPKVDLVLTDPPYQMRGGGVPIKGYGVAKMYKKTVTIGEPWGYDNDWMSLLNSEHIACFCNSYMMADVCTRLEINYIPICIFTWWKRNAPPNTRNTPKFDCEFIVWYKEEKATNKNARLFRSQMFDIPFLSAGCMATERICDENGSPLHPTQKPQLLISKLINGITDIEETILDPFLGSGTTAYCAKKLNRHCIGIEIEEKYCEIAAKRCSQGVFDLR